MELEVTLILVRAEMEALGGEKIVYLKLIIYGCD
jgi:hypothetical protein